MPANYVILDVSGDKELMRAFSRLSDVEAKKALRGSLRDGAKEIARTLRANTPTRSGKLRNSVKVRATKRSRRFIGMNVAMAAKEGSDEKQPFYGGFIEFGWKTGKRGSDKRRQVQGEHFAEKSVKRKQGTVGRTVLQRAWHRIDMAARKRRG